MQYAAERRNLDESIAVLREIADGRDHVLAEGAGVTAGSWAPRALGPWNTGTASGRVHLVPQGWGGFQGNEQTVGEWVTEVLRDHDDVPRKLADHPNFAERHAFIWATPRSDIAPDPIPPVPGISWADSAAAADPA
jgi:hypothetical protein